MNLQDELKQLEAYYSICNYSGKLICGALIDGSNDILNGKKRTMDVYSSTEEELKNRISMFYSNIENYIITDF